jgi:hypothetical protein
MKCHESDRDVDVEEHPAFQTVHVIVPFHTAVVPACLVGKRQLLDHPVLREQVQRAVDRAVSDTRITPTDALKDLARRQVTLRPPHLIKHFRALRCIPESLARHVTAKM